MGIDLVGACPGVDAVAEVELPFFGEGLGGLLRVEVYVAVGVEVGVGGDYVGTVYGVQFVEDVGLEGADAAYVGEC